MQDDINNAQLDRVKVLSGVHCPKQHACVPLEHEPVSTVNLYKTWNTMFEMAPCSPRTLDTTLAVDRPFFEGEVAATFNNFDRPRFLLLIRWSACGVPRLRSRVHFPSSSTVTRI